MRRCAYIMVVSILLTTGLPGYAQPAHTDIHSAGHSMQKAILREFHAFRQAIEQERLYWEKQTHSHPINKNLLYKLFRHTQKNLLKQYQAYSQWEGLLTKGAFDCVTGSMVYAYLLGKTGIPYEIIEAPYHVFIKVHLGKETIVLESTDKNGFLEFERDIAAHTHFYAENGQLHSIRFVELVALYYYNQAANAFNHGQWETARRYIDEAALLYPSARILELKAELDSRSRWMVAHFN
ncbi:hypothetical protein FHS56_001849 [Thermonema lapsum]|uniref:Protein SirB1 N-terminal domain-containing protein n=1 Tax=Thermonema lapsum TaxID=28195 RepID=A0A846MRX0_9BACT|nr:hypothetical protein [Thermonema lapsum]NIK74336.1 hypothetical protein [Thermonema lapsum]